MSARANTARSVFRRSMNPYVKPRPCGPVNGRQPPKRKTGINETIERFQKLIVDLNKKNQILSEMVDDFEHNEITEEQKDQLLQEFHNSIKNHRKSLTKRLSRLNEIEEQISIFRFDEPQPQPPKKIYPPINPNIPSPRAHLRTCPRHELAKLISKSEHDQLTAKALYLERMIVLQKMRLKLFHDHRDLAKLSKALGKVEKIPYKFNFNNDDDNLYENDVEIKFGDNPEKEEQLNTNEANTEENIEESNEVNNEANTEVNNEANNEANNELNNEESNELNKEITNESNEKTGNENENEKIEKEDNEGEKVDYESERKRNETEVQNENIDESEMPNDGETENLNENENEIENSPKEFDQTYESINIFDEEEEERMKKEIHNLKEAINHEKHRIKQYESNYYNFFEAASKIQKTWRGFHFRLNNCKPKGNLVNAETSPDDGN